MRAPASADSSGLMSLRDEIDFVTHVADCYPDLTSNFANELVELLTLHHAQLEFDLCEKVVGSLGLLRRKSLIPSSL